MQDMIFTTDFEESIAFETIKAKKAAEKSHQPKPSIDNPYLMLKEYVTESHIQIRGEEEIDDDETESSDSDSDYTSDYSTTDESSCSDTDSSGWSPRKKKSRSRDDELPTNYREIDFAELHLQEKIGMLSLNPTKFYVS